jgi:hypothetical protein
VGDFSWGLLGPETLASERRTRTLGLGATVRSFNDLAVPGLGGVWFGKQLFLATLGVAVAERARNSGKRAQNIEVTNAVEALACWLALNDNGWKRDPRLRGATKMLGKTDFSFANMRRPSFYVTQPMRQATVQPLRALGLVESSGERFNSFICTQLGHDFIDAVCGEFNPYNRSVLDHLAGWAKGTHDNVKSSPELTRALSPLNPMSKNASEYLRERIVQGTREENSRRRKALDWIGTLRTKPHRQIAWDAKPENLDDEHWRDLHAGALFFAARDAAIALLDQIEADIANKAEQRMSLENPLPEAVVDKIKLLRERAQAFFDNRHDPSPGAGANIFCRECAEQADARVVENLLAREGRVLRLREREILPGVAFRGIQIDQTETARSPEEAGAEAEIEKTIPLPADISNRVRNLFLLNLDLTNELNNWLGDAAHNDSVA